MSGGEAHDLVLSSGFLAFAGHSGFLQAVEDSGVKVAGVMGTSAGALAGSLYCAGYTPRQVAMQLSRDAPIQMLQLSMQPWRGGALSLQGVIERLRDLLPPRFEDLQREFAVGVVTRDGRHVLVDSGPLPEAVAASAAVPFMFQAVDVPGFGSSNPLRDGGVVDRIGLRAWRDRRRLQISQQLLHERSSSSSSQRSSSPSSSSSTLLFNNAVPLIPSPLPISSAFGGPSSPPLPHSSSSSSSSTTLSSSLSAASSPLLPPPAIVHVITRSSPFSGADDTAATGGEQHRGDPLAQVDQIRRESRSPRRRQTGGHRRLRSEAEFGQQSLRLRGRLLASSSQHIPQHQLHP
ncbi:MAG: hypothetical protein WDW36_007265 [Sanguina aurantia]